MILKFRTMRQGSETLKRVHFELGGKNPVIVFDDADLDRALDAVVFMIYSLNGERCTSSSRLLVQQSIADKFIARLVERAKKIKVGPGLQSGVEMGPLVCFFVANWKAGIYWGTGIFMVATAALMFARAQRRPIGSHNVNEEWEPAPAPTSVTV